MNKFKILHHSYSTYVTIGILLIFLVIYSLISLVNHYLFRTYALDLGLYTNAMFKYSRLNFADNDMFKLVHENILGGHFDLYLLIFSPLIYLFGTYTLLIIQIGSIILGAIGVNRFMFSQFPQKKYLANWAMLYYLSFFGFFSALSNDYHSVVVATGLIPWFFYFFYRGKEASAFLMLIFILFSQENVALFALFIMLGLIIEFRNDKGKVKILALFSCIAVFYFAFVLYYIIPYFSINKNYGGFQYSILGQSPFDALMNSIIHPVKTIKYLFINHLANSNVDYMKIESHLFLLFAGVMFVIFKPTYLLMLVPLYGQKFFHDNYSMWGINGQYSVEFASILTPGIFLFIAKIESIKVQKILAGIIVALSLFTTIRLMDHTLYYSNKLNIRFYQVQHYKRNYNVKKVHHYLAGLPNDAVISAQSQYVPQLCLRHHIYQFPIIKDAQYIVYSRKEGSYPLSSSEFNREIDLISKSENWTKWVDNDDLVILKRK